MHRQPNIAASRLPHRLQVFVNRVAAHPVLCKSPDLQLFLEATEDTWAVEMARGQVRASRGTEGQPAGRLMTCAAGAQLMQLDLSQRRGLSPTVRCSGQSQQSPWLLVGGSQTAAGFLQAGVMPACWPLLLTAVCECVCNESGVSCSSPLHMTQASLAAANGGGGPKNRLGEAVGWFKGLGQAASSIVGAGGSRAADSAEDPEYIKVCVAAGGAIACTVPGLPAGCRCSDTGSPAPV